MGFVSTGIALRSLGPQTYHSRFHRGCQIFTASSRGTPTLRSTSALTDEARSQLQVHSVPSSRNPFHDPSKANGHAECSVCVGIETGECVTRFLNRARAARVDAALLDVAGCCFAFERARLFKKLHYVILGNVYQGQCKSESHLTRGCIKKQFAYWGHSVSSWFKIGRE
jgi:hypothetical protein